LLPRPHYTIPLPGGRTLALGERTLVMGILNVTPDSFAEATPLVDPARAIDRALEMEAEGADIIDVGGESTRPRADAIGEDEELRRVVPVLEGLAGRLRVPISIDTYKARVARAAVDLGAAIVNDVSGLRYDASLARAVAETGAAVVLMHMRGRAADMYREASYGDVVAEVRDELAAAIERARTAGVDRARIVIDPGIGFAKLPEHSLRVLGGIGGLAALGRPLLVGPSRKSFLQQAVGEMPATGRDWATAGAVAAAVLLGVHVVRVHAVAPMVQVVRVADEIRAHATH
jgi:dihydropteroate synthase